MTIVNVSMSVEQLGFPIRIKSKFKTLDEWLNALCDNKKPEKHIEEFVFNYYESSGKYTLHCRGINNYREVGTNTIKDFVRIEFKPKNMYFRLPHKEYRNLDRQQVNERISNLLKEFVQTEKFKTSYLAEADAIVTSYNGEKIWTK